MVEKPWGNYLNILDEEITKVKRITLRPGESPSYQYHHKRGEVWVIVQGTARTNINGILEDHGVGDAVRVPIGAAHTLTNTGHNDLIYIEVQFGTYFGEDDIVRLEDKYGRG
jgi:mannose-6-phosphate isomerase-like protein (cupin superfamily)